MFAKQVLEIVEEPEKSELTFPFSSTDRETILADMDRLLESHYFNASRRCSSFLSLIIAETLEGNIDGLKERSLGATLFNRAPGYDTNADPVVRVTAGEVRKRLSQHYQKSGTGIIRIVLPVGSYVPRFEVMKGAELEITTSQDIAGAENIGNLQNDQPHPPLPEPIRAAESKPGHASRTFGKRLYQAVGAAILAVLLFLIWKGRENIKAGSQPLHPTAFATFWNPFTSSGAETMAVFAEMPRRGLTEQLGGTVTSNGSTLETVAAPAISGVGEVMGMHALDEDFKALHLIIHAKRGSFFTFDEADGENLIFLGSSRTDQLIHELPTTTFDFQTVKSSSGKRVLAIVNKHPLPGEPLQFFSKPATFSMESDYALIALMPGVSPAKHVLLLAGITTFGTEGAVNFVSREESLKTLLPFLRFSNTGEIQPFEALIKVTIKDEVPMQEQIVAVHQG